MLSSPFKIIPLLSSIGHNKQPVFFSKKQIIFSHGDRSDSIFYIEKGALKLTLTSANGKEASRGVSFKAAPHMKLATPFPDEVNREFDSEQKCTDQYDQGCHEHAPTLPPISTVSRSSFT